LKRTKQDVNFRGRYLGILFLVGIQFIVGLIHLTFGLALILDYYSFVSYSTTMIYSVYTLVYGFLTIVFTYLVWKGNRIGWIGTVAISIFVIIVDSLAVFNLSNILCIPSPKFAATGEIPFSILILVYLLQGHVRSKYNI
jgi:hypothetical protein